MDRHTGMTKEEMTFRVQRYSREAELYHRSAVRALEIEVDFERVIELQHKREIYSRYAMHYRLILLGYTYYEASEAAL